MQELEDLDIDIGWSIQMINDQSFYVVIEFTNPEFVSQYANNLDRIEFTLL